MRFSHTPPLTGDLEHWQYDTFLVRWPVLVVNTRLVGDDFGRDDEVSMRVPPTIDTTPRDAASVRNAAVMS